MMYHAIIKDAAVVFRRIIFWAGFMACAVSCRDEELMPETDTGGLIVFRIMERNPVVATRAASGNECNSSLTFLSGSVPLIVGGDTIGMEFSAGRNCDMIFTERQQPLTRGASFGNGTDGKAVAEFKVTAFRDKSHKEESYTNPYLNEEPVTVSDGFGRTGKYWPAGSLSFCAYAWSKENGENLVSDLKFEKTDDGLSGSFSYSLPEVEEGDEDKRNDPANQPDLVFAMTPDVNSSKNTRTAPVDLLFHHALSAIVLKVGTIKAENVKLKSIALENFYGSGICKMSTGKIESSDEYNGRNNVTFDWTQTGEQTHTYVLGLNGQQAKEGDRFGKDAVDEIEECTFMMIPQDFANSSMIVLKFTLGENPNEYVFSKPLEDIKLSNGGHFTGFLPDTKYIFTIGLNGDVDITVEDNVEGSTKKDVTIQNTGIANGYIRAAIVGYWADENGTIVMDPWDETGDGTFSGLPGSNWERGNDGYWYYTVSVPHNGFTTHLFESYMLNEDAIRNHPGQKLVLDVVAQIVIDDEREKAGWPKFGNQENR